MTANGTAGGSGCGIRVALRAEPGHAAAAGNLGRFLRLTGEIEAAETVLREVIAANPQAATARSKAGSGCAAPWFDP